MIQRISYGCTALVGTNKVGDLARDENGYYEVVLGGLNAINSAGDYYPFEQAKQLFEGSSELMRRINSGNLRGEAGHPRFQPGMNERQWFTRVADIYEPNICVHIASVHLSFDTLKNKDGSPMVAVIGRIRPSGANERYLERQLDNRLENVCFSVRSFTQDIPHQGRMLKIMRKLVTWDNVNEPGIHVANKYSTPSLESMVAEVDTYQFSRETLADIARAPVTEGVGMEAADVAGVLLSLESEIELPTRVYVPASYRW